MGLRYPLFRYYFPESLTAAAIHNLPSTSGIVLLYHEVLPDDVNLPAWTIVRESSFRWQMQYICTYFDIISMDQALERISGKQKAKRPFAVVTFDDGYKGISHCVLPVMESMGLPFVVYVATQAVLSNSLYWYDKIINLMSIQKNVQIALCQGGRMKCFRINHRVRDIIRWKEVQRLLSTLKKMPQAEREKNVNSILEKFAGNGSALEMLNPEELSDLAKSELVTIGSHTHRHELLDQICPDDIRETLDTANKHLIRITGCPPKHFAYPNGNFNECVKREVLKAGYETAVTTIYGIWTNQTCPLEIPRLGIGRFETNGQFKAIISGYL